MSGELAVWLQGAAPGLRERVRVSTRRVETKALGTDVERGEE